MAPVRFAPLLQPPPGTFTVVPVGGTTFPVGQPVALRVTVTNKYTTSLWLYSSNDGSTVYQYLVQRLGQGGSLLEVSWTAEGRSLLAPVHHPTNVVWVSSTNGWGMAPGSRVDQQVVISRLFDMSVPGRYVIRLVRQGVTLDPPLTYDMESPAIAVDVQKASPGVNVPLSADNKLPLSADKEVKPP